MDILMNLWLAGSPYDIIVVGFLIGFFTKTYSHYFASLKVWKKRSGDALFAGYWEGRGTDAKIYDVLPQLNISNEEIKYVDYEFKVEIYQSADTVRLFAVTKIGDQEVEYKGYGKVRGPEAVIVYRVTSDASKQRGSAILHLAKDGRHFYAINCGSSSLKPLFACVASIFEKKEERKFPIFVYLLGRLINRIFH